MKDKDTKESELLQIQNMSIHQMWLNELTILETELEKFAQEHQLAFITIQALKEYRRQIEAK